MRNLHLKKMWAPEKFSYKQETFELNWSIDVEKERKFCLPDILVVDLHKS